MGRHLRGIAVLAAGALAVSGLSVAPAAAGPLRPLQPGSSGRAVRALQVRVAGWYPASGRKVHFALDGVYGEQTASAVRALQRHYHLKANGVAGPKTARVLRRLQDEDGSTAHFDWSEFQQNRNPSCSAQANAYAGTFGGGLVAALRAKRNVRRLMWRLEALRAKGRGPVGVNSGFRSVAYNDCIGGARSSQHMFGTAADNRMTAVSNNRERRIARRSQFHGIGCYASLSHNHFDVRIDNPDLPSSRSWWWPQRDGRGRDLDSAGRPCWGEKSAGSSVPATSTAAVVAFVRALRAGAGSSRPSAAEVRAFAAAGELARLRGRD